MMFVASVGPVIDPGLKATWVKSSMCVAPLAVEIVGNELETRDVEG